MIPREVEEAMNQAFQEQKLRDKMLIAYWEGEQAKRHKQFIWFFKFWGTFGQHCYILIFLMIIAPFFNGWFLGEVILAIILCLSLWCKNRHQSYCDYMRAKRKENQVKSEREYYARKAGT